MLTRFLRRGSAATKRSPLQPDEYSCCSEKSKRLSRIIPPGWGITIPSGRPDISRPGLDCTRALSAAADLKDAYMNNYHDYPAMELCQELMRNLAVLTHAMDMAGLRQATFVRSAYTIFDTMLPVPDKPVSPCMRYVISACTARLLAWSEMCLTCSDTLVMNHLDIASILCAKPMPGWADADFKDLLELYAYAEMHCSWVMETQGITSCNTALSASWFGSGCSMDDNSDIADAMCGIRMESLSDASAMLRSILSHVIREQRRRLREATAVTQLDADKIVLDTANTLLPAVLAAEVFNSAVLTFQVLFSDLGSKTQSFSMGVNAILPEYASSGFPDVITFIQLGKVNCLSIPYFTGYDSKNLLPVVLFPSTERAAAMLRRIYGLPGPETQQFNNFRGGAGLLANYDSADFGKVLARESWHTAEHVVSLGLDDIRSYIFNKESRPLDQCPQDELFHKLA